MQYIWFNKNIKINKKSIYWENFFKLGIHFVQDLYDEQNKILPFNFWKAKGLLQLEYIKWHSLVTTIKKLNPNINKQIDRNNKEPKQPSFVYKDQYYKLHNLKTKIIYCCIRYGVIKSQLNKPKIWVHLQDVTDEEYKYAFIWPYKLFTDSKSRVFQYKFLNNILINNYWLTKWKLETNDLCTWCKISIETQIHLFWECDQVINFWRDLKQFCDCNNIEIDITKKLVFIGCQSQNNLVNIFIILAKQYLQKSRNKNEKINIKGFICFLKYFWQLEYLVAKKRNNLDIFIERWENIIHIMDFSL
jgi:hypothetical protein